MAKSDNRIMFIRPSGIIRYTKVPLSRTAIAVRKRRCRERMKKHIDARICSRCRYAFISRYCCNNCSDCMHDCVNAYKKYHFVDPMHPRAANRFMAWAYRENFFPQYDKTIKPKIPIPDIDRPRVQQAIRDAFALLQKSVTEDRWIVDSMPRLMSLGPYPNAPMVRDLRRKVA